MSTKQEYTEADIECGKAFDTLRKLKAFKEQFVGGRNAESMEVDGRQIDTESLVDGLMIFHMRRFKELVDMNIPVYADFIRELEELPGMARSAKLYDQMRAAG